MALSRIQRSVQRNFQALLCLSVALLSPSIALAGSAGILPFSSSKGVPNGAAENIASLVSTEIDIRGGYDLVMSAGTDEVAAGCGERSACVDEYGNENDFVHVVTGSVSTAGANRYTLVLTLYKVGSGSAIRQVLNTLDRSPDALLNGIPDLVVELLTGQRPVHEEDSPQQAAKGSAKLFSDGDDFSDSEDSSNNNGDFQDDEDQDKRKWMERDRHGRLTQPVDGEEDPLGLDEIDDLDLDLDELSSDHQTKKRKQRSEREAAARAAHAEEERLAQVAEEERSRRMREREIRERERQQDEQRLEEQEERRIAEERQRRQQDEQRRSREEQRREEEREQAREERRREEKREQAREERRREEKREQAREERRREEQRQRMDRERREERDRERERERDRREAEELDREERERRNARARFEEDQRAEERKRREERDDYQRDSQDRYDEDEEDITLDAGIIIIESDEDEEEEEDEDGGFGILIEEDGGDDEEPDYNRSDDRDDERSFDERQDFNIDQRRNESSRRDRKERRPRSSYERSRRDRSKESRDDDYDVDRDERSQRRGNRAETKRKQERSSGRPPGSIHAFVGYNYYYLSFLRAGLEGNIYVLPALSLDFSVEAWMLWVELPEGEDDERRMEGRVLPNFLVGASYRMRPHPVVKPFVGGDIGTVIYAQNPDRTPLFALVIAAKGGSEFDLPKNFGLFVTARVGVSISGDLEQDGIADIQQWVNETWSPTRVFFNIGAGALYRF
jgi:hypothetical protein